MGQWCLHQGALVYRYCRRLLAAGEQGEATEAIGRGNLAEVGATTQDSGPCGALDDGKKYVASESKGKKSLIELFTQAESHYTGRPSGEHHERPVCGNV